MHSMKHKLNWLLILVLVCTVLLGCDDGSVPAPPTQPPLATPAASGPTPTDDGVIAFQFPTAEAQPTLGRLPNVTIPDTGNPPRLFLNGAAGTQRANVGSFCWTKGCINRLGTRVPTPTLEVKIGEQLTISNSFGLAPENASIQAFRYPTNPEKSGEYDGDAYYFYARGEPAQRTTLTPTTVLTYSVQLEAGDYILIVPSRWPLGMRGGTALYSFHVRVK